MTLQAQSNIIPGEGVEIIDGGSRHYYFCPECKTEITPVYVLKNEVETLVCEGCFWTKLFEGQADIRDAEFKDGTIVCTESRPETQENVEKSFD